MRSHIGGSKWYRRFAKDCKRISPYIRLKLIKFGFIRIYWKNIYIHEVYKEMPQIGYDKEIDDPRFESRSYFEELEDKAELTRKIKNYVEGYWDSLDVIKTRVWLLKNSKEHNKESDRASSIMTVK